jgi:hypothetical protein
LVFLMYISTSCFKSLMCLYFQLTFFLFRRTIGGQKWNRNYINFHTTDSFTKFYVSSIFILLHWKSWNTGWDVFYRWLYMYFIWSGFVFCKMVFATQNYFCRPFKCLENSESSKI